MRWTLVVLLVSLVAPVLLLRTRRLWRLRRLGFDGDLTHRITVPPDADGRPGETFLAPSRSPYLGRVNEDGSRSDCTVVLSRRQSVLLVVCLGPSTEHELGYDAARTVSVLTRDGCELVEDPAGDRLLGQPAKRYRLRTGSGHTLTEWKLDHHGWRYAIGILLAPGDGEAEMRLARSSLASWQWLHDAAGC